MSDLPQENASQIEQVRSLSQEIIKAVSEVPANVAVMACLDVALRIVQGGAGIGRIQGIDALIETLYKIRAAEVKEGSG